MVRSGMLCKGWVRQGNQRFTIFHTKGDMSDGNKFESDPKITRAVAAAWKAIGEYKRGEIVPYAVLETATGYARGSKPWRSVMRKLRKVARSETGLQLWEQHTKEIPMRRKNQTAKDGGVKLVTPREQIDNAPTHRRKKKVNQDRKSLADVLATPDELLSERDRELKHAQAKSIRDEHKATQGAAKFMRSLFGNTKIEPRG